MKKVFHFEKVPPLEAVEMSQWEDWHWQFRESLKTEKSFSRFFDLTESERAGFAGNDKIFRVQTTPYYASLAQKHEAIRKMVLPRGEELQSDFQEMLDPLGENKQTNRATQRLIHRYTDRALFLATDICSVYCRYCTRKHFTASDQVLASIKQVEDAVQYVKDHPEVKEIIFSGGDPLTIGNSKLEKFISQFYEIDHVEIIRIGTRMPVVCPMRIDDELVEIFKKYKPIFLMTHFNHPAELTVEAAQSLEKLVDNGVPVFNQMVLLDGVNNSAEIVRELSRKLLYQRVKPYYMFQADPSLGTDHMRTSIDESLDIQKQLWGHLSGLAMPNYVVDIPGGGGKAPMVPNFQVEHHEHRRKFIGFDGVEGEYISPKKEF